MFLFISILFWAASSIIIDPINNTCIYNATFSLQYNSQLQINLHFFNLHPFSQSIIIIDLRHFIQIPNISNIPYFQLKAILIQQSSSHHTTFQNIQARSNKYKLVVDQNTKLGLYFNIIDGQEAYKYLLYQSVSIQILLQNYRIQSESSSFLFVISSKDNINLPANRPTVSNYRGYYLDKIIQDSTHQNSSKSQTSNSYWTTFSSLAIPFIPYISNCKGESNRIFISQAIQNTNQCKLISINDTVPIDQFKFGTSPTADTCRINRECLYDQAPLISSQFPYWLNLPSGSVLFYITQNKVSYADYLISNNLDLNQLVPCKINDSKGDNSSSQYPLNVKLTLEYYQYSQQVKKMISCAVEFSLYMDSSPNFTYQFQLQMKPLNHTYIMLAFGFQWYVYMIVFVIIGFISNMQNLVLWLFHFCASKKKKKSFKIMLYLKVIGQISKGTFIALFFCTILVFSVCLIMNGKVFKNTVYSSDLEIFQPRVFWDYINNIYIGDYTSDLAVKFRSGRMGLSFLISGSLLLFYMSKYFIGYEKKKKQYNNYQIMGRQFKPREWNRAKFLFGTFIYIFIQFFFIYFAYSALYSQNIWTFIVMMKIIQIIMQQITLSIYQDLLPCLPFKVITDITAYMNTLSANNLYDFLFSFLIDVAMTMIEKAYIPQLQNMIVQKIVQKMNQLFKFYAHIVNDTQQKINQNIQSQFEQVQEQNQFVLLNIQSQQVKFFENQQTQAYNDDSTIDLKIPQIRSFQKKISNRLLSYHKFQSKQYTENHNNQIQEIQNIDKNKQQKIQQCSTIFQILLDNILLLFTFILQPFVLLICWVSYDQSGILNNYGIDNNVVILYILSAIVIAIFTINNMVLIFQLLQSYLEVDFDEKIVYLLDRFFERKLFWKANDQDLNNQIKVAYRGADHYCLSWQFFLILTLYVGSMSIVILGISIMINSKYNPFKDQAMPLIIVFWLLITFIGIWLVQKIAYGVDIDQWRTKYGYQPDNSNAIAHFNMKQEINIKNQQNQKTSNPNFSHQNSQHQLIGSILPLKKLDKSKEKKQSVASKNFANSQDLYINQQDSEISSMSEQTLKTKANTICKKLQSKFISNNFNIQYFRKNKQFVKRNIQKILPLVEQLPQITQHKIAKNQSLTGQKKGKKNTKAMEHITEHVIKRWKEKVQIAQKQRQKNGKQLQQNLSSCTFCFSTEGIYFGFGGMCLKCSRKLFKQKKQA